jgi:hypothetical protein
MDFKNKWHGTVFAYNTRTSESLVAVLMSRMGNKMRYI